MTRIVTIDGPAGAGKTTVSRILAHRLGCVYVDTGALYRGAAYEIQRQGIQWENDHDLEAFLKTLDLCLKMENGRLTVLSSGVDISELIRTPDISMLASATSARPQVRAALLGIQQSIAKKQDAVFEGRDMGTVVFPKADRKFFLYADPSVRARRRFEETPHENRDLAKIQIDMALRDRDDAGRAVAPLKPAPDAVMIDSTDLTIDQVVEKMLEHIEKQG